jgi:hypothetical protein
MILGNGTVSEIYRTNMEKSSWVKFETNSYLFESSVSPVLMSLLGVLTNREIGMLTVVLLYLLTLKIERDAVV